MSGPLHRRAVLAAAVLVGGCSGTPTLTTSTLSLAGPGDQAVVAGTATEVYALVARGAVTCWFGVNGPLKATHIFHADAAPPSAGGAVEITVHERDPTQPNPRGTRALLILIANEAAGSDTTRVVIDNKKFPTDLSDALRTDAFAWARGAAQSCEAQVVRPPPAPEPVQVRKKLKAKVLPVKSG